MANDYIDVAALATINDQNAIDAGCSDILDDSPALAAMPAIVASNGTNHKYIKNTGKPVVGFRSANDGRENDHSEDTLVTAALKILDASFRVDKAVADAYAGGAEALIAREAARHLRAAFASAESQIFDGTGADAGGFSGLANSTALDAAADALTIDAGGTTADTASSVYLIRTGDADAAVVLGQNGNIEIGETVVQQVAGSTGFYSAYYTPIEAWVGLQVGSIYSVGRIINVTADSGKGLTDALIASAIEQFPAARGPSVIAMNRRSLSQLQSSRTATNATGQPAPFPAEAFGIPVVVTDGISSTEALIS